MNTKFITATADFFARKQSKKIAVLLSEAAIGAVLLCNILEMDWMFDYITYVSENYLFRMPQVIYDLFSLLFTDFDAFIENFDWLWSVLVTSSWNTFGEPTLLLLGCGALLIGLLLQNKKNVTWLLFGGYALLALVCFGNVLCTISYLFSGVLTGDHLASQVINVNYLFWYLVLTASFFVVAMQFSPQKNKVPHNIYFIGALVGCLASGMMNLWQTGGVYVVRLLLNGERINFWNYLDSYIPYSFVILAMGAVLFGTLIYAPYHFETE